MSDQNTSVGQHFDDDRKEWPAPNADELRQLFKQLAELRAKGIIPAAKGRVIA